MSKKTDLTADQEKALDSATRSHDSLQTAQLHLHHALAEPQPGRESSWAESVLQSLSATREGIERHLNDVLAPHGLYEEIQLESPRLAPRLDQCERQLRRILTEADDLQVEIARVRDGDLQGLSAIRSDAEHLLASLRDVIAKENDLIFERFNEPPALD